MAYITDEFQGTLISIAQADGNPYPEDDWRQRFLDIPGLITIRRTENQEKNGDFIAFFPFTVLSVGARLRTGTGVFVIDVNRLAIHTKHSTYIFRINTTELDDEHVDFLKRLARIPRASDLL